MFDKLFGKICVDRGWIRQVDLEAAIRVRENLLALGLDRPIGEILVSQGLISVEQAETIIHEQQPGAPQQGEVVLGQLAVQNGLIEEAQLNRVLEKQREAYQREHTAPTLGFLLVEEGYLTLQQLDALIALQSRLQLRSTQKIDALLSEASLESSVPLAYFVRSRRSDGSWEESEHLMTGPGVRAMIASGELKPSDEVRREDEELSRRISEFPEFSPAVTELRRRETLKRTVESPEAKLKRRRLLWKRVTGVAAAVVLLGSTFALGMWVAAPAEPDDALEASWQAEDLLAGLREEHEPASDDVPGEDPAKRDDETEEAPDEVRQRLPEVPAAAQEAEEAFLRELGLRAASDLLGVRRFLPAEEARTLQAWREQPADARQRLQPFESESLGLRLGVPADGGFRMVEGQVTRLSAEEVERHARIWRRLRAAHAEALKPERAARSGAQALLELAAWLEEEGWSRHARRVRLDAYRLAPNSQRVWAKLAYLGPGENPHEPTQAKLLTTVPRPQMPLPPTAHAVDEGVVDLPGMFGEADGELPLQLPWPRLQAPLGPADVLEPLPLVPDPAAARRANGEVAYLGYWLPRETLARHWHEVERPARFVLRPGQAEVWTDLPQFRGEILSAAGRIYTLVSAYVNEPANLETVVPPLGETGVRTVPCRLVVLGPGGGEAEPLWVEQAVATNRQRVVATDLRSPEALVLPLARGVMRAVMQASYGDAVPAWLQEAWARELAAQFARAHQLTEWERLERGLDLDRLAARTTLEQVPADFFDRAPRDESERALAWALWRALPEERLEPLLVAVEAGEVRALEREAQRLAAWVRGRSEQGAATRYMMRFLREQSEVLREEVALSPSLVAVLTPAHLDLLAGGESSDSAFAATSPARDFFSRVTGHHAPADAENGTDKPPRAAARRAADASTQLPWVAPLPAFERLSMSHYTLRELSALLGLGARLRLLALEHKEGGASVRAELESLFTRAKRSEWLAWLRDAQQEERTEASAHEAAEGAREEEAEERLPDH